MRCTLSLRGGGRIYHTNNRLEGEEGEPALRGSVLRRPREVADEGVVDGIQELGKTEGEELGSEDEHTSGGGVEEEADVRQRLGFSRGDGRVGGIDIIEDIRLGVGAKSQHDQVALESGVVGMTGGGGVGPDAEGEHILFEQQGTGRSGANMRVLGLDDEQRLAYCRRISTLKMPLLKAELRAKGLDDKGKKEELLSRLRAAVHAGVVSASALHSSTSPAHHSPTSAVEERASAGGAAIKGGRESGVREGGEGWERRESGGVSLGGERGGRERGEREREGAEAGVRGETEEKGVKEEGQEEGGATADTYTGADQPPVTWHAKVGVEREAGDGSNAGGDGGCGRGGRGGGDSQPPSAGETEGAERAGVTGGAGGTKGRRKGGRIADLLAPIYIPSSPPPPEMYLGANSPSGSGEGGLGVWWDAEGEDGASVAASLPAPASQGFEGGGVGGREGDDRGGEGGGRVANGEGGGGESERGLFGGLSGWKSLAQIEGEERVSEVRSRAGEVGERGRGGAFVRWRGGRGGSGMGGAPTCFRCGQVGHVSRQCMEEQDEGGGGGGWQGAGAPPSDSHPVAPYAGSGDWDEGGGGRGGHHAMGRGDRGRGGYRGGYYGGGRGGGMGMGAGGGVGGGRRRRCFRMTN